VRRFRHGACSFRSFSLCATSRTCSFLYLLPVCSPGTVRGAGMPAVLCSVPAFSTMAPFQWWPARRLFLRWRALRGTRGLAAVRCGPVGVGQFWARLTRKRKTTAAQRAAQRHGPRATSLAAGVGSVSVCSLGTNLSLS